MPLTTLPVTGQETDSVAKSPTDDAKGWYCVHNAVKEYVGLVLVTVPDVGLMTIPTVPPISG